MLATIREHAALIIIILLLLLTFTLVWTGKAPIDALGAPVFLGVLNLIAKSPLAPTGGTKD